MPEEVKKEVKSQYELIITICNKGTTDLVMDAARKAGGQGGTITTARGTGNPDFAKFYGVNIQPEKEIVYIVAKKNLKDKIMKQIYDDAGLLTKGTGIVFSMPITDAIGLDPILVNKEQKDK